MSIKVRNKENQKDFFNKNLLNFYLNVKSTPKTDWRFILGQYSFLGYSPDTVPKLAVFDFDGILEKQEADELYKLVLSKMIKINGRIQKRANDLVKWIGVLQTPEGYKIAKDKIVGIFKECKLTKSEYDEANEEAAKEFIKESLVNGAKNCIERLKHEMGYLPTIISAGFKQAEIKVCEYLGILKENVTATQFLFDDDKFYEIDFVLGSRRTEAKNDILKRRLGRKYGCYFIFDNDPILNASTLKSGLNPAIIIGDYLREELVQLNFDVFTCCPEARDNLLNIIPSMDRFEYGWIIANILPKKIIDKSFNLSAKQRELFNQLEFLDVAKSEFSSLRDKFVSLSLQILDIKEKFHLITEKTEIRNELLELITVKKNVKKKIENIFEFFEDNVPETEVLEGSLYEEIQTEYKTIKS